MSQLVHTQDFEPAVEGHVADLGPNDIISGFVVSGEGPVGFGLLVSAEGTHENPDGVQLPQASADVTANARGVSVADQSIEATVVGGGTTGFQDQATLGIIRKGRVWVRVEDAVTPASTVFVRHTADTAPLDKLGSFRSNASGGDAVALPGARFKTSAAAGELALLDLDLA